MATIRRTAVAGRFYPAEARTLHAHVAGYIPAPPADATPVHAVIAPHAGYQYSGPIAGSAYAAVLPRAAGVRRVVLIGPAHWVPVDGIALSSATAFDTPLGPVPVDRATCDRLATWADVRVADDVHAPEHSLEVHLPFLQTVLRDFVIVPLLTGRVSAETVAALLGALWDADDTLIVVSSDLSHYHDYATACRLDRETAHAVTTLTPLAPGQACGRLAINGLLHLARREGWTLSTRDLRNSGDTAGPRDRVVGYGAFVAHSAAPAA